MTAAPSIETRIDELYQLPLDEFTPARNALAKELSGDARAQLKTLAKPSLPMWAINQLHWQDRPTYKALVDASEKLRAAHRAALNGRKADTRAADRLHQAAIERGVARTLGILKRKGISLSDAAMQSLRITLAALPTDEKEGRLTREPAPAGFSLLTGIKPREIKTEKGRLKPAPTDEPDERKRLEQQKEEERRAKAQRAQELKAEQDRAKDEIRRAEQALEDAKRKLASLK